MRSHIFLASCIAIGSMSCGEREPPSSPHVSYLFARQLRTSALGCYRLDVSQVTDLSYQRTLAAHFAVFRLRAQAAEDGLPGHRAVSGIQPTLADSAHGITLGWVADSLTDSIGVGGGDLFGGFGVRLGPVAGGWQGRAYYSTDVGPPFEYDVGPVRAFSVSCAETSRVAPPANDR